MEESLEQVRGDYYMDVREFKNGSIEVLLKAIRPMHEGAIRSMADPLSYANACKALGESPSTYTGPRFVKSEDGEPPSEFEQMENHRRAVRRAKQQIRWKIKAIEADRLLTLTYRNNEEDREKVKADFKRFVRLVRAGWGGQQGEPKWCYVAVLERQERGAYHIHCAVKGWQRVNYLRAAWFKALGGRGDEKGEETPGNVDVTSPRKTRWGTGLREWKSSKLAAYITKYLAKTFDDETTEKKRYWHSKDVEIPARQRFILRATDLVSAIVETAELVETWFGQGIDFTRSWLSSCKDSLWLSIGEVAA